MDRRAASETVFRYSKKINRNIIASFNHHFFFQGFSMEIYIATDGRVLPYILDPNFENYLPVIPPEVTNNF